MRYVLILAFFISFAACHKNEQNTSFDFVNRGWEGFDCVKKNDPSITLDKVNQMILGKWRLQGMLTQAPTNTVPDLYMTISSKINGNIEIYTADIFQDDKKLGTVDLKLTLKTFDDHNYVYIINDLFTIGNTQEYNFINGMIRICDKELLIDNGMASDAPGYLFRKL